MWTVLVCGLVLYGFAYRLFWVVEDSNKNTGPGCELISHRGVTISAPENTIQSYLDAVDKGFRWIELDVLSTKDGALICSHNFDLERETDLVGYIHQTNLKALKSAHTGVKKGYSGGFRIPQFVDVLSGVPDKVGLNIEIKHSSLFDFSAARALCRLRERLNKRKIIISSFNPVVLFYIKLFYGQAQVGFLVESKKYLWIANWLHPTYLHPRGDIIDSEILTLCKERNMGILAWTINNRCAIKWCFNNNVTGVITDRERSTL